MAPPPPHVVHPVTESVPTATSVSVSIQEAVIPADVVVASVENSEEISGGKKEK
jgi:hypothetical protein